MNNNSKVSILITSGLGTAIAVMLSYAVNKSMLWMIIHGFFGWFYVVYYAIKY